MLVKNIFEMAYLKHCIFLFLYTSGSLDRRPAKKKRRARDRVDYLALEEAHVHDRQQRAGNGYDDDGEINFIWLL